MMLVNWKAPFKHRYEKRLPTPAIEKSRARRADPKAVVRPANLVDSALSVKAAEGNSLQETAPAAVEPARKPALPEVLPMPSSGLITPEGPPSDLGKVALQRNQTLWHLIVKVYGVFGDDYLAQLKAANPDIKNPNQIQAGRLISIPAILLPVKPAAGYCWVKFADKTNLADALQELRTYPRDAPPVRMIPFWDEKQVRFSIVMQEVFKDYLHRPDPRPAG